MSKFTCMTFSSGGAPEHFVAHARKYAKEDVPALCMRECGWMFEGDYPHVGPPLRKPSLEDVFDAHAAFRINVSPEWENGCYTFVDVKAVGAFPVWVILLDDLRAKEGGSTMTTATHNDPGAHCHDCMDAGERVGEEEKP